MHLGYRLLVAALYPAKIVPAILALAVAIVSPAGAYPQLILSSDDGGSPCSLWPENFTPTIYVTWGNWSGETSRLAFGASLSPNSGYMIIYQTSPYSVTGNPESGMVVDFGSCLEGSAVVMRFGLYPVSAGSACPTLQLTPHPSYGGIRYTDCNGNVRRAERSTGIFLNPLTPGGPCESVSAPPYDPYPLDGATYVPVSLSLEWSFDVPVCGDISGREDQIYFGTTANPPLVDYWGGEPYPLQPLQPSTTYYWKVFTRAYGLMGTSPVWSFTTASVVSTKRTTWGAIKALYR